MLTLVKREPWSRAPHILRLLLSFYHRFTNQFRTALRSLGLGILTYVSIDRPEPSKVLIDRSLRLALARSLIHLLPATLSTFLIVLNLRGWFIGAELQGLGDQHEMKMGLLQISAKLQVSSASTLIVMAICRGMADLM